MASLYQTSQAFGPCQECGGNPSRIEDCGAHVAAIVFTSPLLKASIYCRMAPMGSVVSARAADAAAHANSETAVTNTRRICFPPYCVQDMSAHPPWFGQARRLCDTTHLAHGTDLSAGRLAG